MNGDFQSLWQFNNCLGAVGGKRVQIAKPANSGSYYFNYKETFSIVMLAYNGRISDGGFLQETAFYHKLINKKLNLPNPTTPERTNLQLPYAFVGDQAFSLMENLMKPYPDKNLTKEEKIFNYRLSRARRVVENAFGIMASVFRVFHSVISADVKHVDAIILACCALHNFLRRHAPNRYMLGQLLATRVLRVSGYPGTRFYLKIKNITRVLPDPPGTRVPEYPSIPKRQSKQMKNINLIDLQLYLYCMRYHGRSLYC